MASHLSLCKTPLCVRHHPEKRRLRLRIEENEKTENIFEVSFFRMVILRGERSVFPGTYRVSLKKWKSRPCFVAKSVKFRSFEVFLVPSESSRRDLESGHGFEACF